jgi:hypothetical protein
MSVFALLAEIFSDWLKPAAGSRRIIRQGELDNITMQATFKVTKSNIITGFAILPAASEYQMPTDR